MKISVNNLRLSRKKAILTVGIGVFVLLVAYGVMSTWAWSQSKVTYTDWRSSVKGKLDLAMGMPVTTAEQKTKWLDALDVASNAAAEPNKCIVGLYQWQQAVIPALKSEAEDCQHTRNTIDTLHSSLTTVVKSIRTDEAIAAILSELLKTTTVNEAAYQTEIDSWSKASASLRAVDAPNEVTGVKAASIAAAEAIKMAWNALMAANTVQNASQYQTALGVLSEAYGSLNNVSSESKKALQTAAGAVQKAYDDAF